MALPSAVFMQSEELLLFNRHTSIYTRLQGPSSSYLLYSHYKGKRTPVILAKSKIVPSFELQACAGTSRNGVGFQIANVRRNIAYQHHLSNYKRTPKHHASKPSFEFRQKAFEPLLNAITRRAIGVNGETIGIIDVPLIFCKRGIGKDVVFSFRIKAH